ncbi:MAG: hypothetical protein ABSF98_06670 [Bryobacteraceae bacterium]|jgi:hypothetical protein
MKALWLTLLLAGTLLLTGCGDLMSLESIATKDNTVFDKALLGTWTDNKDSLCVVGPADPGYNIAWIGTGDTGDKTLLEGRLVKMGDQRVLDVWGADPGAFSVPAHVFLRVRISGGTMELRFLDSEWLQQRVRQSSLAYSVFGEGHPIITAPPAQVRTFLQEFGLKEEALSEPILLTRLVSQR